MKKKILITGSEGFIGSHVVEFFLKKNFFVKAFVYYNSFNSRESKPVEICNFIVMFIKLIKSPAK